MIWYNGSVNFDRDAIKLFVQQTLGCGCPEEVFEFTECKFNVKLNDEIVLRNEIKIGNRLLIYVLEVNNTAPVRNILPLLVTTGKAQRDDLKFNRFRLVLITEKVDEIKESVGSFFNTINKDEKIHLHVVNKEDIPDF